MKMLRRFSTNHALFCMFLDGMLAMLALKLAFLVRPYMGGVNDAIKDLQSPKTIPTYAFIILAIVWVLIYFLNDQYDPEKNLRVVDEVSGILFSSMMAGIIMAGTLYLSNREISRVLFLTYTLLATIFSLTYRLVYRLFFRLSNKGQVEERRVLIAGAGVVGRRLADQFKAYSGLGYVVVGFVDDSLDARNKDPQILGSIDQIKDVIQEYHIDQVVTALPRRAFERLNQLVIDIHTLPVRLWVIPDYFAQTLSKAKIVDFAGMPMIDLRAPALNHFQRMTKRVFDLCLTIPLLVLISPVLLIIAILIKSDSPGPAFYVSKRVKEYGEYFGMIKFRTMRLNADQQLQQIMQKDKDGNLVHKRPDDPRVTKIGKFLRKTSLDELPQLFNIIKGDMSLIGPRPELPELVNLYEPWQRKRFTVPQGVTGWWQVNGRSDKPMHLNTQDDLYYIQHYSIWLDLQILLKTVLVVIRGRGAF
jgi:exopolysaccharide biosynthesis polyprenyl glycosylphosphotransferase